MNRRLNKQDRGGKHPVWFSLLLVVLLMVPYGSAAAAPVSLNEPVTAVKGASKATKATTQVEKKWAYGVYAGQADSHTVEIMVYGEAVDLQFSDKLETAVATLEEGDLVAIQYTEQKFANDPLVRLTQLLSFKKVEADQIPARWKLTLPSDLK